MPGTPVPKRPQTSKQAKRAYQKSGGTPGLSKTDLKRLERAAVLQERANRIKKREAQKAVNRQKRMEKEQKEREARKRMGIPEPKKAYVSPRQERLSQFVRGGGKGKELEAEAEDTLGEEAEESEGSDQSLEDLLVDQSCLLERGSPVRPLQPKTLDRHGTQDDQRPHASLWKPASTQLDDWAAFFVSNTQIQRELTDDESDTASEELESMPVDKGFAQPPEDGTTDFLRHIATQDLEFDIDEQEEVIPIEETLPMFPSQDAETSGEEQTDLGRQAKDGPRDSTEADDPTSFLLTQDLDFSEDELDEWEPSQGFRARSQGTVAKLGELRCQLAGLKDAQPPAVWLDAAKTGSNENKITVPAEHPDAANQDDESEFAFSSQDLLALEAAAVSQDVTEGPSPSGTFTGYSSDGFGEDSFDKYIERMMFGEEEFNMDRYTDWLTVNQFEADNDYDYGGL